MRSKKAIKNTFSSLMYQMIAIICGLILPRMILVYFGSSYNGITSSINQFLQCASLLVAGVGGVTRAALYKPLASQDFNRISAIVNATDHFMKRVALILAISITAFACVYPILVRDEFEWLFSFTLVLILGISTFMQYYFGVTYQMLLMADQRQYIISCIQIVSTVLNTIFAVVLMKMGFGIHAIKLGSAIAFSINPLFFNIYVKKYYKISKKVEPDNSALKQRWDAFGQSVAFFVHNNTDIIVLTIFANIKEVSVYTVYNYIISNIRIIVVNFITGFGAAFGNMLAKGEYKLAEKNLKVYELIIFNLSAVIYTTAGVMIVPFAMIYTKNITDVSYSRPLFAALITIAGALSCFRIPYQTIVEAAGHFKQTRNGAIFEAILNISISLLAVIKFGLVGVAFGTLAATLFRSIQYAVYLSKHIIKRNIGIFFGHVIINILIAIITVAINEEFFINNMSGYLQWGLKSLVIVLISGFLTILFDFLFYRKELFYFIMKIKYLFKRKKKS